MTEPIPATAPVVIDVDTVAINKLILFGLVGMAVVAAILVWQISRDKFPPVPPPVVVEAHTDNGNGQTTTDAPVAEPAEPSA